MFRVGTRNSTFSLWLAIYNRNTILKNIWQMFGYLGRDLTDKVQRSTFFFSKTKQKAIQNNHLAF